MEGDRARSNERLVATQAARRTTCTDIASRTCTVIASRTCTGIASRTCTVIVSRTTCNCVHQCPNATSMHHRRCARSLPVVQCRACQASKGCAHRINQWSVRSSGVYRVCTKEVRTSLQEPTICVQYVCRGCYNCENDRPLFAQQGICFARGAAGSDGAYGAFVASHDADLDAALWLMRLGLQPPVF